MDNLEREFCTSRYAAVMNGWWSCSPFLQLREDIFIAARTETEEQLQAYHSRKGAPTFQKFINVLIQKSCNRCSQVFSLFRFQLELYPVPFLVEFTFKEKITVPCAHTDALV